MPGQPAAVGPWPGGLNNWIDASAISDQELAVAINFDIDPNGFPRSRPPVLLEAQYPGMTGSIDILGTYATQAGNIYVVLTADGHTWLYEPATLGWTDIWNHAASGCAQYLDKIVLISEEVPGGYWGAGTWTGTSTMPLGSDIVFFQARLWAFGAKDTDDSNTVWFSNIDTISVTDDPSTTIWTWDPDNDFFIVGPGDGQWITAIQASPSYLLIFRNASTWQFTYSTAPADGTLRVISQAVGADSKRCVVAYETYWYVFNQGTLYQFLNLTYYPASKNRIVFAPGAVSGGVSAMKRVRISKLGDRVLVWYWGSLLVYGVKVNAWSQWISEAYPAQVVELPFESGGDIVGYAVTGSADTDLEGMYRIADAVAPIDAGEEFDIVLRTKSHIFGDPTVYKRLYYWAAEVATATGITGYLHPVTLGFSTFTWDDLDDRTWDELEQGNWDALLDPATQYVDDVPFPLPVPIRLVMRMPARIRFQRCAFEIQIHCDGTVKTAPTRIYSIIPYLGEKTTTSRQVS